MGSSELTNTNMIQNKLQNYSIDISALALCIISYVLLYFHLSQKLMSSLMEWQDYLFHVHMTRIVIEQNSFFPRIQGHPVLYPPLFHNMAASVSFLTGLSIEQSLICTACLAGCGFSFLSYLFIREISKSKSTAFLGMIFLGVGGNILTYVSSMIFFGRIYILIIGYVISGFLPHILGHFLGIFMLFLIVKTHLTSWYHVLVCSSIGILLILTHLIASVTYLIALLSLFFSLIIIKKGKLLKKVGIILIIPILITSPWWSSLLGDLMTRPYLFFLADAGESWISQGTYGEIITYYGFLPLFSIIGTYNLIKKRNISVFIIFWTAILLFLIYSPWGFRFALDVAIPLYILSAIGIITGITHSIESKLNSPVKILMLFIITLCVMDFFLVFRIFKYLFL
jgi:hypothetical protein